MDNLKILILDDEERVRDEIEEYLEEKNFEIFKAGRYPDAIKIIHQKQIDIAVLDIKLPNKKNGLDALAEIKEISPTTEVIMISGHGDMNSVIEAMRKGAIDYFQKPVKGSEIYKSIEKTKRFLKLNKELLEAKNSIDTLSQRLFSNMGHKFIGKSKKINLVREMMNKVAQFDTNVLITGESGTGKELVAHGIHYLSQRHKKPFHSVNCSAIPESLFESEFFGHKKGAFTGANEDKPGWFEIANNGTLFLDEIGDMPLAQQAKLLRILEYKKVSKVGSREILDVDVRVIAASNQELEKMSHDKKFRLDLYYRLSTFIIDIPPLRERYEDIPVLLDEFIRIYSEKIGKKIKGYSPEVVPHLSRHQFPGNIRELRNMTERAIIICEGPILQKEHFILNNNLNQTQNQYIPVNTQEENTKKFLQEKYYDNNSIVSPPIEMPTQPEEEHSIKKQESWDLEQIEKEIVLKAMEKANNNKSKAAKLLKISWQALDRRLKKYTDSDLPDKKDNKK
ncbi:MAG: sigma-54-dependent transcriptional regulator [Bacteroidales bacterium]